MNNLLEIQNYIIGLSEGDFGKFLSKVKLTPLLTIEEELELIHHIRQGGEVAACAREQLARFYLRFIVAVAKQHQYSGLSIQNLVVSGITGLERAAEKYDETRGFKFLSYAYWWILQSMQNTIKKQNAE